MQPTVLIVDDEKNILLTLHQALSLAGYKTELAAGAQLALDVLTQKPVDAVLMDVKMPDMDGLTALAKMTAQFPALPILMMSGHGTIETAVKATQLGARDFLEKPIARDRLLVALKNALSHQALVEELSTLKAEVGQPSGGGQFQMVGHGAAMERLYELIRRAAPSEGRVLVTGENGTGKELVARALHQHSRRKSAPFVKLNCAAVPHELIESELFGHERGAFTGAVAARRGKFELAHEGTLFLDEVGDMPPSMQAKLLRVLQEGELERVGGSETLKVDVRVIAATNKDLEAEVKAGRFREDLYYRLNVVHLRTPPLRERKSDLPELVGAFLQSACARNGKRPMTLLPGALDVLKAYDYPGNVRELQNLVERLAILCVGPTISADEVRSLMPSSVASAFVEGPSSPAPGQDAVDTASSVPSTGIRAFRDQVDDAERQIILAALTYTKDNVTEAARLLDLERGHFYKKMKSLGLKRGQNEPV
jgi:two-component system, NtrC family, nitrogen regulation response regulator NtrX